MNLNSRKMALFLGDVFILFFALYLTLFIRYGARFTQNVWQAHFKPFLILYALWLLIFYIVNLYDLTEAKISLKFYQKLLTTLIICGLLSVAFFYLNSKIAIAPKTNLFLNLFIVAALFSFWRYLFNWIIGTTSRDKAAIVGYSEQAYKFSQMVNNNPQLGVQIAAFCDRNDIKLHDQHIKMVPLDDDFASHLKKNNINTLVINNQEEFCADKLLSCFPLGINFISFTDFYETLFSIVPIGSITQRWFIENLTEGKKRVYDAFKRIIDIFSAITIGIFSLPLIPFIAIAIKLNSKGPIFFRQIRTGKNGKDFMAIKFRSMIDNAETDGRPLWSPENDPRITAIGKILRQTRLDEIPQLLNVLKGEMSLVGPRPERPEFIKILGNDIPFYKQRLLVKPGLTGWAQVNLPYGSSREAALQKLQYDLYYIKHRSLFLDLKIILKTIAIVFGFKGR